MGGIVRFVHSEVCICKLLHAHLMPHSLTWPYEHLDHVPSLLCMRCPCNIRLCLWTHVLMEADLPERTWNLAVQAQSLRTMNPAAEDSEIPSLHFFARCFANLQGFSRFFRPDSPDQFQVTCDGWLKRGVWPVAFPSRQFWPILANSGHLTMICQ